jgi:N-acetylmuramoyl-L-alanine amidase
MTTVAFRIHAGALLCLFLAGCAVTPMPRGAAPEPVTLEAAPESNAAPATVEAPEPAPLMVPIPAVAPGPAVITNETDLHVMWAPLESWCQANGFTAPRRSSNEPQPYYAFASANGVMDVKIASEVAYWNGLEFRLGFPPQLINGRPYVHWLDLQKNFEPLKVSYSPSPSNRVIVIDPGHGGTDSGTSNVFNGHFEKEYALDLARRLQALLSAHGWTALLTRSNDVTVPLVDRVAFAEKHQAALFISLHFNSAFPDRQQSGLETYCLTPTGMSSSLTRGYADNAALIYPNNRFDDMNLELAMAVHRAILEVNGHLDRGVRRARFLTVLQGQNRPAVLVEGGYLSNPREAREIAEPAYRQKLAEALAQALSGDDWTKPTNLASEAPVAPLPTTNSDGKMN